MLLDLADIRNTTLFLFDFLERNGITQVEIKDDYYWHIPRDIRYDPLTEIESCTLGQLTDDITELSNIVTGKREATTYAFVWLSNVLRYIGEIPEQDK